MIATPHDGRLRLEALNGQYLEPPPGRFDDDAIEASAPSSSPRPHDVVQVLSAGQIAEPLPPLEHLVEQLGFAAGGGAPHLIAGYGFSLKSMSLQSLLLSHAAGVPVWGAYPCRRARVLHVDLEQGHRLTCMRYQRLAAGMSISLNDLEGALELVTMPRSLALSEPHYSKWQDLMVGRDLILVDSLKAATAGVEENDSGIRGALDLLGRLSEETKCRALVIHHAKKPGSDGTSGRFSIRGSSAIFDAVDSAFVFSAERDEAVEVTHVKARSTGVLVETVALTIADTPGDNGPKTGLVVRVHGAELIAEQRAAREKKVRDAKVSSDAPVVMEIVVRSPGIGTRELREAAKGHGFGVERVTAALTHLIASGKIEQRAETRDGSRTTAHYATGAT